MMKTDYLEVAKILLPITALVISILTIYFTRKNIKKQIKVNKIEEILEILNSLSKYYMPMFWLVNDAIEIREKLNKGEKLVGSELDHSNKSKEFIDSIDKEVLERRISRLYILVNAYVSNKANSNLKLRILALSNLYGVMFQSISNNEFFFIDTNFKEGIPKRGKLSNFIIEIENDLIKEMDLGHRGISHKEFIKYRDNQFKIDTGIRKS